MSPHYKSSIGRLLLIASDITADGALSTPAILWVNCSLLSRDTIKTAIFVLARSSAHLAMPTSQWCFIIWLELTKRTWQPFTLCAFPSIAPTWFRNPFHFYRAMLAQSAVMRLHVVRPSVRLSVRP